MRIARLSILLCRLGQAVAFITLALACSIPAFAEEATARLYKQLRESVVTLYPMSTSGSPLGSASGVVIRDGRTVLTNYHAVAGAKSVLVAAETATGQEWRTATIHENAPDQDLASIRFEDGTSLKAARLASKLPEVGTSVLAIGSPLGLSGTLSTGVVSQVHKGDDTTMIQTTAPISPGSSGGGLFTESGELIAITSMYLLQGQQLNFAVYVGESSRLRPYTEIATPAPGSPESRAELDSVYVAGIELRLGDQKDKVRSYFDMPRRDNISMSEAWSSDGSLLGDFWTITQEDGKLHNLLALLVFENDVLKAITKYHSAETHEEALTNYLRLIQKREQKGSDSPKISTKEIDSWEGRIFCVNFKYGPQYSLELQWGSETTGINLSETLGDP